MDDARSRLRIPAITWSKRWRWCMGLWSDSCATWLATWKRTGSPAHLASAARYAQLHERGTQRWMAALAREGFR